MLPGPESDEVERPAPRRDPRAGIAMAVAVAVVLPNAIPVPVYAQDASRGAALLAEARTAIGGEQRLAGVRTLQVTGTFRRVVNGNDTEGDFEVFIELPDRYLRSEKTGTPGQPSTETIEALVGVEVRDEVRGGGGGGGRGAGGANVGAEGFPPADFGGDPDAELQVEGRGDRLTGGTDIACGRAAGPAGGTGPGGGGGVDPDAQRQARQADVSRLLLMWLLKSDMPLAWIGIAESPDGKADVLKAKYADGRPTRLFVEAGTHMPLMMQWEAVPVAGGGGRGRGGRGAAAGKASGVARRMAPVRARAVRRLSSHST